MKVLNTKLDNGYETKNSELSNLVIVLPIFSLKKNFLFGLKLMNMDVY